jgi:transposase
MNSNPDYIAIDIARDSLQVQTAQQSFNINYEPKGLKKLLVAIKTYPKPMLVCEATGGYERELMALLFRNNIPVALLNPARVRAFARSEGLKAKSDPLDAKMLLRFALEKRPLPSSPPEPAREALAALLDRRSQLTGQIAREKNRRQKSPKSIQRSIEKMIRFIEKELKAIDARIRKLIESEQQMQKQSESMQQVSGVGEVTAWTLLAYLSEIGWVGRNRIVALAGVAPYDRDSGKIRGKRHIQAGRAKVRRCLYMAAQSAAIHNPVIKAYVDGLRKRGKPYKCAIVAAIRKLLIHLQSLIKNNQNNLA